MRTSFFSLRRRPPLARSVLAARPVLTLVCGAVLAVLGGALPAAGQGFLVPADPDSPVWRRVAPEQPVHTYRVDRIDVDASLQDQVATVQVSQTFRNTCSQTLQVRFVFPMPYDGAVDRMTFLVDGEELPGKLMDADAARKQFTDYVRRMEDPALVQWIGPGVFQTQVFPVPAGAERTVSLRYTQLLRRTGTMTDWLLPLKPAASSGTPVGQVALSARIRSSAPLANVYSPTHEVEVKRPDSRTAQIKWKTSGKKIEGDLRLMWDMGEDPVPMSLVGYRKKQSEDGYFMLLLQPDLPEASAEDRRRGKHVILVLDKSGSMKGEKIDQARSAVDYVLKQLKPRDRFELIAYDNTVEAYSESLVDADKDTVRDAQDYVSSLLAGGGTNFHEALQTALETAADADGSPYVVFLTDGRPTVGTTDIGKIVAAAKKANDGHARLLSLGVGHDVNSRLLDKLSMELQGRSIYVSPGEAIDDRVQQLYDRIGAPALTDVKLTITVDGKKRSVRQLYPDDMLDLFSGDQVVVVGRYRHDGDVKIELSGDFDGQRKTYQYSGHLPDADASQRRNAFVERLWAVRRIGTIIDQIDLNGEKQELVDELIALSKQHGVLTPYTAFLADEDVDLNDRRLQQTRTRRSLQRLQAEYGADAFRQRATKGAFKYAPRASSADSLSVQDFAESAPPTNQASGLGGIAARSGSAAGRAATPALQAGAAPAAAEPASRPRGSVRQIAGKTFFARGKALIDAEASDQQIREAEKVEQFSQRYFDLLKELDEDQKEWLAQNKEVLVVVADKAYRIVSKN
ncbi:VIT domain-containing protein [Roseimaritima sediminicola]|uniref:VIT domain-containing protein n=1 Tax=Roseimaritima sediminicola TaxID=2662066 RepID=UPI0012983088|nr:VIT domain-containing protein [Roseimaritima sediminicola]